MPCSSTRLLAIASQGQRALCLVRAQLETLRNLLHGGKVVERERFLKRMIRRIACSPRNHCRGTLEGFESRIERTSGRMTASVTRQNKDSQRTRLLELRERSRRMIAIVPSTPPRVS